MIQTQHGPFTDKTDMNGNVIQTAEEAYQQWLNDNFDLIDGEYVPKQIDNCSGPTMEEQLLATQKMVLSLQEQIIDML